MNNNNIQQQQKKRAAITAATTITTANEESKEAAALLLLERKIAIATEGFVDHITTKLRLQSKQNIETICDYILAMNAEVNPSLAHKRNQMQILCYLSTHCKQKPFIKMTRKDILGYLDSLRKWSSSFYH
jgi:hypothetical protein